MIFAQITSFIWKYFRILRFSSSVIFSYKVFKLYVSYIPVLPLCTWIMKTFLIPYIHQVELPASFSLPHSRWHRHSVLNHIPLWICKLLGRNLAPWSFSFQDPALYLAHSRPSIWWIIGNKSKFSMIPQIYGFIIVYHLYM